MFIFISYTAFLCLTLFVKGQRNGDFPFVEIEDSTVNFNNTTTKSFTTKVLILHLSNDTLIGLNEEIIRSITEFYQDLNTLQGFITVSNLEIEPITDDETLLIYMVTYNYAKLLSSAGGNVKFLNEVGTVSAVKNGFEKQFFFSRSDRTVSRDNFTFTGDSLCARVGCDGNYVTCTESTNGVTTSCSSSCKQNFCINGGWCHHADGNLPPTCTCQNNFDTWYIGERCELFVQLWMFVIFIVVIILAIIIIIVTTCVFSYKLDKKKFEVKFDKAFQKNENKLSLPSVLVENANKLTVKDVSSVRSNSNKSSLRYVEGPTNTLHTKENSVQRNSFDHLQNAYTFPNKEGSNSNLLLRTNSISSDNTNTERSLPSKNDITSTLSSNYESEINDYDQKFHEIAKSISKE